MAERDAKRVLEERLEELERSFAGDSAERQAELDMLLEQACFKA